MFLKGKPLDEYKGFSYRLVKVAIEKGIEDTRELADALYENEECKKAITIRKTQKKNPDDPLKNIMKNIQIHLNTEDAYEVNSRYMYAYSTIFDCSYDYLYGRSEIMTADLDVRDICNKTGLSEKAVVNLVERHQDEIESSGFSVIEWWSELLYDIPFTAIPMAFMAYASRLVELHDIDKKIDACEKAVKDVSVDDPIIKYLMGGDNQKTLKHIRRDKEDSILGAHHKMVSCVADLLNQYAEQWAEKQHPEYSELYYHGEINKRKIINEALKTQ